MKLINIDYGIDIEFEENRFNVLVIESGKLLSEFIWSFLGQYNGITDGNFVLSENNKSLNIGKAAELITDPFRLDFNNKKITSRLYQEISEIIQDKYYEKIGGINSELISVLDAAVMEVPYHVEFSCTLDIGALLKMYGVKAENHCADMRECLTEYIKLMSSLCGIKLFVIVGIGNYMNNNELKQLYETLTYEKVSLLLLENRERDWLKNESVCIIDKDRCLIQIQ